MKPGTISRALANSRAGGSRGLSKPQRKASVLIGTAPCQARTRIGMGNEPGFIREGTALGRGLLPVHHQSRKTAAERGHNRFKMPEPSVNLRQRVGARHARMNACIHAVRDCAPAYRAFDPEPRKPPGRHQRWWLRQSRLLKLVGRH